jgi:hypothetical protein
MIGEPLLLFATKKDNGVGYHMHARLYSCQIYENNILIRDFVPVVQNDRTYGLYDLVENKFYANIGAGTFTGKSFSPEFKAIYLGSDKEELAPFSVTNTGKLTATNATINGTINAASGTIGGFDIETNRLVGISNTPESDGKYSGVGFAPTSGNGC